MRNQAKVYCPSAFFMRTKTFWSVEFLSDVGRVNVVSGYFERVTRRAADGRRPFVRKLNAVHRAVIRKSDNMLGLGFRRYFLNTICPSLAIGGRQGALS